MKIKNIFALAASLCIAFMMSTAAHAATEVKVGDITTNETGTSLIVPIVLNSTDEDVIDGKIDAYEITLNYNQGDYRYASYVDPNKYQDATTGEMKPCGIIAANDTPGFDGTRVVFAGGSNGFPTVTDGKLTLVNIYLQAPEGSTLKTDVTKNDFSVGVKYIQFFNDGTDKKRVNGTDMTSFFTFDVTGTLGGNNIVGIGVSFDNGVTIKELTKYFSTTLTDDTKTYAEASTTFLVAVDLEGTGVHQDRVIDSITVYGEKEDGTYIPLGNYGITGPTDFQVQTFYRN